MTEHLDDVAGDPDLVVTGGPAAVGNYAVIGHPVAHSRSPELHEAWFRDAGLPGRYTRVDIAPGDLVRRGPSLPFEFTGLNITIPHKVAILGYVDAVDASARSAGAANLLYRGTDGAWTAGNTDGIGLLHSLEEETGAPMLGRDVVILGAGGAARAIAAAILREGVDVTFVNRSLDRARALADELGARTAIPLSETALARVPTRPDLVINTLPPAANDAVDALSLDVLPDSAILVDINYYAEAPLLTNGASRGLYTLDGRGMFLWQAALSFQRWTGLEPNLDLGRRLLGME